MKRPIKTIAADEGLSYDPDRAQETGLHEEMKVWIGNREVPVDNQVFDALLNLTELGVGIGPGEKQEVNLRVEYQYDYGRVPQTA